MGKGGYHSGKQPDDLPVEVGGLGTAGQQELHKDINDQPLVAQEAANNGSSQGDQGSWAMPEFANGTDVRKTYVSPSGG